MGIEYPYLALVSAMLFIVIVTSAVYTYLWVLHNISMLPRFEAFASFTPSDARCNVTLTLRLTSGVEATLESVVVATDSGTINVAGPGNYTASNGATVTVNYEGFDGKLLRGQEGRVIISIDNCTGLFTHGKRYSVLAFLDEGIVVSYFMPNYTNIFWVT